MCRAVRVAHSARVSCWYMHITSVRVSCLYMHLISARGLGRPGRTALLYNYGSKDIFHEIKLL